MSQDHYAILGVAPTAPTAAVRAAYLSLMREYHPDRNPSPAATLRAQAIIAAFKVIGDFDARNEYDWGRRRARDKAAALAAASSRKVGRGAVTVGAIGLAAAVAAYVLRPGAIPAPKSVESPRVEVVEGVAKRPPPPVRQTKKLASSASEHPKPKAEPRVVAAAVNREPPDAKTQTVVKLEASVPARAKPKPTLAKPRPVPKAANGNDLASLDQFVMSFYGQSWRYGDARKRAALEQSRDGFVVRRGACLADSCKRAAYLKLMRDVSEIVETGRPQTR